MSKQNYEFMVIMKPLLPDNVRKGVQERIHKLIEKPGGSIKDKDVWGKRYLAYNIGKHTEGYYTIYQLEMPQEALPKFKKEIKQIPEVLRFLVIKKD